MPDSLQQQYALADALVAALSDHSLDLAVLVADLALTGPEGQTIRANLPRRNTPRQECVELIRTCLRYPNGHQQLRAVLELHLGQTSIWPGLEAALSALLAHLQLSIQKVYISYAWGDSTPEGQRRAALADKLCDAMQEAGITVLRDREQVKPGDRISAFMKELAKGDLVLVVLSDHYLKSEYCMFELYEIWKHAKQDEELFLKRVIPLILPDAQLRTTGDKLARGEHWLEQKRDLEARLSNGGLDAMGEVSYAKYRLILQFSQQTADMLELLTDKCEPRDFDRQAQEGFREVLAQILAARKAAGG